MARKLNKRQATYCYYRARDYTIEESLSKAGYKIRGANARSLGSHMETKDNIRQYIDKERLNIFDKSKITEEYILEGLRTLSRDANHDSDKIRSFELLGKYLALWKDVSNSKVDMNVSDERRKEIEGLIARYRGVGISTG